MQHRSETKLMLTLFNLIAPVVKAATAELLHNMNMSIIGPKLERKLGRPLTDWDWRYYWQEVEAKERRKAYCDLLNLLTSQWQRQVVDRQIIRDFVEEQP
jgi:hypothetical protein